MRDYMAAHTKELPRVKLQFEGAQGDVVHQLNQVQNFAGQGVDAIIVNPVDTASMQNMTDQATQAHIPLVYVNRRPGEASLPPGVGYIGSDEVKAGELQMQYLAVFAGRQVQAVMRSVIFHLQRPRDQSSQTIFFPMISCLNDSIADGMNPV